VEFLEVVGGRAEPPFGERGGSAASLEAVDLAVVLRVSENRHDRLLSLPVDRLPVLVGEHAAHVVIETAGPSGSGLVAQVGVGRDQHLGAVADDVLHLALVPVAGVGDHDPGLSLTPARSRSAASKTGLRCPKSGDSVVISAAMMTCA
jgi:hypothetical protein